VTNFSHVILRNDAGKPGGVIVRRDNRTGVLSMRPLLVAAALAGTLWAMGGIAHAAPPAPGSEDYDQLTPYADWLKTQQVPGDSIDCCNLSDCRVVAYRAAGDQYEALIASNDDRGFIKFEGGPDRYVTVPDNAIKRGTANPTGRAIACWTRSGTNPDGVLYCFFLPELS